MNQIPWVCTTTSSQQLDRTFKSIWRSGKNIPKDYYTGCGLVWHREVLCINRCHPSFCQRSHFSPNDVFILEWNSSNIPVGQISLSFCCLWGFWRSSERSLCPLCSTPIICVSFPFNLVSSFNFQLIDLSTQAAHLFSKRLGKPVAQLQ